MYNKNPALASLLSTRICHDLISPIGAISNGLELMQLSGTPMTEEYELMASSVQSANARINFFRIAFGPAGKQDIANADVSRTLNEVYANSRYAIDWQIMDAMARSEVKLLFLMIQCIENTLPRGGQITISRDAVQTRLHAQGAKIKKVDALWDHLLGHHENENIQASEIHFELALGVASDLSKTIHVNFDETQVEITL